MEKTNPFRSYPHMHISYARPTHITLNQINPILYEYKLQDIKNPNE